METARIRHGAVGVTPAAGFSWVVVWLRMDSVDLCLVFPMERMGVGWRMFPPEHLDNDTEELANGLA
jgi:hypothetical protein